MDEYRKLQAKNKKAERTGIILGTVFALGFGAVLMAAAENAEADKTNPPCPPSAVSLTVPAPG